MEGDLRDKQLAAALRSVGRKGRTGILTVQGREEIIAFSFSSGGIVGADALNQSLEHGLGEVLSSQGLVDRSEFAALLAEHEAGGGRVVDLLVERSYLSRGQLLDALRQNTYRLCLEAMSWQEGEYRFYQGDEVAYETGVQPIGVAELLVRSTRDLGDAGPLSQPVPEPGDVFVTTAEAGEEPADGDGGSSRSEFAQRVLEVLDGHRTIIEAAAKARIDVFDLQDLVSEWQRQGFVEKVGSRVSDVEAVEGSVFPSFDLPVAEPVFPAGDFSSGAAPVRTEPGSEAGREAATFEADSAWARAPEKKKRVRLDGQALNALAGWLHRAFGLALLVVTGALLTAGPTTLVFPFPWQGALREDLRVVSRSTQKAAITRGADTFFLLFGRYPEELAELGALLAMTRSGPLGPTDGGWSLSASPSSYVLTARDGGGRVLEGTSWTSSVAGNFLLDPDFVRPSASGEGPLLVLLD